jgi:hypothetical protein
MVHAAQSGVERDATFPEHRVCALQGVNFGWMLSCFNTPDMQSKWMHKPILNSGSFLGRGSAVKRFLEIAVDAMTVTYKQCNTTPDQPFVNWLVSAAQPRLGAVGLTPRGNPQVYGGLLDEVGVRVFPRGQGTFNIVGLFNMALDWDTPEVSCDKFILNDDGSRAPVRWPGGVPRARLAALG